MYVCPLTMENRKGNIILRPDVGARDCHKIIKLESVEKIST